MIASDEQLPWPLPLTPQSRMLQGCNVAVMQILIDNHMLTADEEVRLRQGLNFGLDDRWLSLLYK